MTRRRVFGGLLIVACVGAGIGLPLHGIPLYTVAGSKTIVTAGPGPVRSSVTTVELTPNWLVAVPLGLLAFLGLAFLLLPTRARAS
jgi:hypothetical protein